MDTNLERLTASSWHSQSPYWFCGGVLLMVQKSCTSWFVFYPIIHRVLGTSQVVFWDFWTINSIADFQHLDIFRSHQLKKICKANPLEVQDAPLRVFFAFQNLPTDIQSPSMFSPVPLAQLFIPLVMLLGHHSMALLGCPEKEVRINGEEVVYKPQYIPWISRWNTVTHWSVLTIDPITNPTWDIQVGRWTSRTCFLKVGNLQLKRFRIA